jgi:hypothetical protein
MDADEERPVFRLVPPDFSGPCGERQFRGLMGILLGGLGIKLFWRGDREKRRCSRGRVRCGGLVPGELLVLTLGARVSCSRLLGQRFGVTCTDARN